MVLCVCAVSQGVLEPNYYKSHPEAGRRLRPWLHRELSFLVPADSVQFLVDYIISLLPSLDFKNVRLAQSVLAPFLFDYTEKFISEFNVFAKCPWDMIAYDQIVKYVENRDTGSQGEGANIDGMLHPLNRQENN
eukprot:m.58798 g.58798  ORF g.58798 m.58798 type:complete len:134 (+) comp11200_c0_seq3:1047-1448(+)